jgi:tetratricopeptide (TPR) repeat protein
LSLAYSLRESGSLSAAAEVILAAWRAQPRTHAGDAATLAFLRECQRSEPAEAVAAAAVAMWPDDAALLAGAGEVAMERGDFAAARTRLQAATRQEPARGASWLRLAHTRRYESADDADIVAMRAARTQARAAEAAICLDFALGKACDDLGDRAQAAQYWREGNTRASAALTWNADGWRRFVEQQLRAPAIVPTPGHDAMRPVFVVGLPRTGTTLLASLLARHPQLRNRGELNWLSALAARLGPQPERTALAAAAALFSAQLRQDDAPALCHLDKNPLNFRHIGLAMAMFPKARVVHCRRGARDTALSIWSQHFAHPDLAWSYDFSHIADFAQGERALMQHWQHQFWSSILAFDYEDLVRDSDAALARVHAFLELPDASVQEAATQSSGFRTASVWQARQAVNARSVGRWREYAESLPELLQFGE